MNRHPNTTLCFLLVILVLLQACGRKNNNFLVFAPAKKETKINKLTLPAVKNVTLTSTPQKTLKLTWNHVTPPARSPNDKPTELLGYAVYRFSRSAFIPKKPLQKRDVQSKKSRISTTKNWYDDASYQKTFEDQGVRSPEKEQICYIVRPVFMIGQTVIEGPTSS